jgi:hypothetical protein
MQVRDQGKWQKLLPELFPNRTRDDTISALTSELLKEEQENMHLRTRIAELESHDAVLASDTEDLFHRSLLSSRDGASIEIDAMDKAALKKHGGSCAR